MKVLHTSDWHIGQKFMGKSREEEHKAFLSWFYKVIENLYIIITAQNTDSPFILKHSKIQQLELIKEALKVWVELQEIIGSHKKNKFTKFAQGITLDQLTSLANNHLNILSSRYELQRIIEQKQLLKMEVCKSHQGNVISLVSTLSGGENFIVSLALALRLSELASQKIVIDSLFLNEAFGTLDEDSLETALNALNLLQSSGKMSV